MLEIRREVDLDYLELLLLAYNREGLPINTLLTTNFNLITDQYIVYKDNLRVGCAWLAAYNGDTILGGHIQPGSTATIYDYISTITFMMKLHKDIYFLCFPHEKYAIIVAQRLNMNLLHEDKDILVYRGFMDG